MKTQLLFLLGVLFALSSSANSAPNWMRYSAISPDGNTIVFSYKGDLYTVPSAGGMAVPLTVHEAYDQSPVWSHDGAKIAFASNRYGNFDVFVVDAKGGDEVRLTFNSAGDFPSDFATDNSHVLFSSARLDDADNQQFPSGVLPELYSVPTKGGRIQQVMTTPAIDARYTPDGKSILFHDQKGYEDDFRKHHTSSVTRDVWKYTIADGTYQMLTEFIGEDRTPIPTADGSAFYYLSEQTGSYNVHKMTMDGNKSQVTLLAKHPIRSLTSSSEGTLCFSYHGELYTMKGPGSMKKVAIEIGTGRRANIEKIVDVDGASEVAVSPNGKEIAFIFHGEVFVTSVKEGTTKRITNTPEQERTIDYSPDGRAILYASERNGSWNLYQSKIEREAEMYFFNSTIVTEEVVLEIENETFQPSYSPDGKEVAFLEERTALKVINLASKEVREIMPASRQYSYSDGDQHYDWSPDGKWFLVGFLQDKQWIDQAGLVSSDGTGEIVNLTNSGYGAFGAQWMMDGKMMMWFSSKDGMKSHASWGGESDVYAMFFTQEAYDEFMLSEEEYELIKEAKAEEEKAKKGEEEEKGKDKKKGKKDKEEKPEMKPIKIELDRIEDRTKRLTIHSSQLSDAYVSNDGEQLFYLTRFEKGYDLWQTNLRTRETKVLAKLGQGGGEIVPDKKGESLFVVANGQVQKIDIKTGKPTPVKINGEMILNESAERAYLFEHVWRQVKKKFYVEDLQGVDWDFYKSEYAKVLPDIDNNNDFAEMLAEMLGELNASHTGASYRGGGAKNGDATASLGLFYDNAWGQDGLKITEVMDKSPVLKGDSKIKAGVVIEKINGNALSKDVNHFQYLNRIDGKATLLSLYNPKTKERWEETVKPISRGAEFQLRYERWVKNCRDLVEELSGGSIGYVHVRGMDDQSFRIVYDETLGQNNDKKALIVDTRFNGGGWLHDDLATFLSGKEYITFMPRGQDLGNEPQFKWRKPSCVVMSESNYSDAHMFPYTYRALGIGQLVGMPVPGTGTAVWWEYLQNGVVFGIPQVGMVDVDGDYLENKQLEPDVKVLNEPGVVTKGRDQQLEAAVKVLDN
ncbi:MAG: Tol biopolymer transport system component/C-terminal processing protease CtpA/Prc [Flavobacteriales bacterium]|jgi:Tol biopolymer transport system component/C-terminal processing protease CtpA/Prc